MTLPPQAARWTALFTTEAGNEAFINYMHRNTVTIAQTMQHQMHRDFGVSLSLCACRRRTSYPAV